MLQVSSRPPWMSRSVGDDEDEPPALPSEPPPAPTWNTFPSTSGGVSRDSFSDVLPETSTTEVYYKFPLVSVRVFYNIFNALLISNLP